MSQNGPSSDMYTFFRNDRGLLETPKSAKFLELALREAALPIFKVETFN